MRFLLTICLSSFALCCMQNCEKKKQHLDLSKQLPGRQMFIETNLKWVELYCLSQQYKNLDEKKIAEHFQMALDAAHNCHVTISQLKKRIKVMKRFINKQVK